MTYIRTYPYKTKSINVYPQIKKHYQNIKMSDVIQLVLNEIINTVVKKDKNKRKHEETTCNKVPKLRIKKPKIHKSESISNIPSDDTVVSDGYSAIFKGFQSPGLHPFIQRQFSLPLCDGFTPVDLPPLDLPPLSLTPSCDFDPTATPLCRITHWRDPSFGRDPLLTAPDGAIGSIFHAADGTRHHFLYGKQNCSKCVRDDFK